MDKTRDWTDAPATCPAPTSCVLLCWLPWAWTRAWTLGLGPECHWNTHTHKSHPARGTQTRPAQISKRAKPAAEPQERGQNNKSRGPDCVLGAIRIQSSVLVAVLVSPVRERPEGWGPRVGTRRCLIRLGKRRELTHTALLRLGSSRGPGRRFH